MSQIPDGLLLLANMGGWLTASRLEYTHPHPQGIDRFQAAALLLHSGKVHRTHERGHYLVESQHADIKEMYQVCVLQGDVECGCPDATISPNNPLGLCVHIIGAGYDYNIIMTLGTRYNVTEPILLVDLLREVGIIHKEIEGRRMVRRGEIKLDGQIVRNTQLMIHPPTEPMVLEVGKHEKLELIGEQA